MDLQLTMITVAVTSTIDRSVEEVFCIPSVGKDDPVLVKLHTWSCDKNAEIANMQALHALTGWTVIAPEFRGPNLKENPRAKEACASQVAKQDIIDAVNTVVNQFGLTSKHRFLYGGSGGGHMALMMAAYAPAFWTAVAAWCPVTDLTDNGIWARCGYRNNSDFRAHVAACCGRNIRSRSPIHQVDGIAQARVHMFHGNKDVDVPFNAHSLPLYNRIIKKYPTAEVYLQIFDGGHDIRNKETLELFRTYLPQAKQVDGATLTG